MDYPVPNFGQDHDIKSSISNEEVASKIVGHKWEWKKQPDGPPRNYFVPNFGVDEDIKNVQAAVASEEDLQGHTWTPTQDANGYWNVPEAADNSSYAYNQNQYINNNGMVQLDAEEGETKMVRLRSDPICSSAGCSQYKHPAPAAEPPRDYPVPDFGQDHDIASSLENERVASKLVGHNWKFKTPESFEKYRNKAKDVDYNFAPNLDGDITASIASMGGAELSTGKKMELMQQRSDPICSSAGCGQYKHPAPAAEPPRDYPVPDFGQDHDVADTLSNERVASKMVGQKWAFKTPESW